MCRATLLLFIFYCSIHFLTNSCHGLEAEEIKGGEESNVGQFTYQVSIEIDGDNVCGGAIIGNQFVVTAAHCFVDDNFKILYNPAKVIAGSNDLRKHPDSLVSIEVDTVYLHEDYFKNSLYELDSIADIAVLKLKQPLPFATNSNLSKLKLPKLNDSFVGKSAIVTGFGWSWVILKYNETTHRNEEVAGGSRGKLRYAKTTVIPKNLCESRYKVSMPSQVLCAQITQRKSNEDEGVCGGDSGSPLVYQDTLIGVVNTSPIGCSERIKPGVYVKVTSYLEFIQRAIKNIAHPTIVSVKLTE